jgi:hypothetical protein
MSGGIYLLRDEDQLVEMLEQPYDSEAVLQQLLAKHPSLLAGDQLGADSPRRWVLVAREASLPSEEDGGGRWSVDHLFLDQDAVPTLVEVKRSSDTRIRREVVGQMLDYAANAVVYWPVERLRATFEASCETGGRDPDDVVLDLVVDGETVDGFWDKVNTNLRAGKVRLIFVADVIPVELRRVIEFLNVQMSPADVMGIEIRQYVDSDGKHQTLVPRLIGQTEAARQAKGRPDGRRWDRDSVLHELESKRGKAERDVGQHMLEWAEQRGDLRLWFGSGQKDGSFQAGLDNASAYLFPFALYTYGRVEIQFQWMLRRPPFDAPELRGELQQKLNSIPGVEILDAGLDKRPSIPLAALTHAEGLEMFLSAMDWSFEQARTAGRD